MFRKLTVGKKIALGFVFVIGVLLTIAAIGYRDLMNSSDGFKAYRNLSDETILAGRIQANMLQLSTYAKDFIITGNQEVYENFNASWESMKGLYEEAKKTIVDSERSGMIGSVWNKLTNYEQGFGRIVLAGFKRGFRKQQRSGLGALPTTSMPADLYHFSHESIPPFLLYAGISATGYPTTDVLPQLYRIMICIITGHPSVV